MIWGSILKLNIFQRRNGLSLYQAEAEVNRIQNTFLKTTVMGSSVVHYVHAYPIIIRCKNPQDGKHVLTITGCYLYKRIAYGDEGQREMLTCPRRVPYTWENNMLKRLEERSTSEFNENYAHGAPGSDENLKFTAERLIEMIDPKIEDN